MKRTALKVISAITLLLLMSVVSYASTSSKGTLTLVVEYPKNTPLSGIGLSIVQVAEAERDDNGKITSYKLTDAFTDSDIDVNSNILEPTDNNTMANRFVRYISSHSGIQLNPGTTNSRGVLEYTDLEPGLYLVMMPANTKYTMSAVIVPVPMIESDGFENYIVTAYPKVQPVTPPDTNPPDTDPPDTDPPDTDPRDTDPPDTKKPDTEKPETEKPDTETDPPDTPKPPDETTKPPDETTGPPEETTGPPETTSETPPPRNPPIYVEGIGELTPTEVEGVYVLLDDDGVPLGYYIYDPELDEWIECDENGIPLGGLQKPEDEELPQTGLLRWPVPVLTGSGMILTAAGVVITFKGKKRDEE